VKSRPSVEIIIMILESARTSTTKTKIMYRTYLAHSQLTKYMKILQSRNLLEYDQQKQLYRTTTRGIKFLNSTSQIEGSIATKDNSQEMTENYQQDLTEDYPQDIAEKKSKDKHSFSESESFYN